MNGWRGAGAPQVSSLVDEPLFEVTPAGAAFLASQESPMADRVPLEIRLRRRARLARLLAATPLALGLAILGMGVLLAAGLR